MGEDAEYKLFSESGGQGASWEGGGPVQGEDVSSHGCLGIGDKDTSEFVCVCAF